MNNVENSDFIIKSTIFILLASILISLVVFFVGSGNANLDVSVADSYPTQMLGTFEVDHLVDSTASVEIKFASDRTDVHALYYYIDFGNAKITNVNPLTDQTALDYIVVGTGVSGAKPCSDENVNVSFALGTFPFDKPFDGSLLCIQASTLNSTSFFENGDVIVTVELEFPQTGTSGITLYSVSRYVGNNNSNIYLTSTDVPIAYYNVYQNSELSCGNGVVDTNEVCDDSNNSDGDSCSADCATTCASNEFFDGSDCVEPSSNHIITGNDFIIQSEDFDTGNNYNASSGNNSNATYYDKNAGFIGNHFEQNPGSYIYRNTDVDIKPIPNTTDGFAIGYSQMGEWLEYTITVPETGEYNFSLSAQAPTGESDNQLRLEIDGQTLVPNFSFTPNVDQWNVPKNGIIFSEQMIEKVNLTKGVHTFRINVVQEFIDLDYLKFEFIEPVVNENEIICGNLDINGDEIINLKDYVSFVEIFEKFSSNSGSNDVLCIDTPFATNNSCGAKDFDSSGKIDSSDFRNLISKYSSDSSQDCTQI